IGLVIAAAGASLAQGAVTLEYRFTPKESLKYQLSLAGTMKTKMPSPMPSSDMNLKGTLDYLQRAVKVASDGTADIEMSCPRMEMEVMLPGQMIDILWKDKRLDLKINGEPQPSDEVNFSTMPFLGAPVKVRMNKLGKVVEFPDTSALEGLVGNLRISEMLKTNQSQLPDHPVGVGDSWIVETKAPIPGTDHPLTVKTTYLLEGFETLKGERAAKIVMKGSAQAKNLEIGAPAGQQVRPGMTFDELSQEMEGAFWFSVEKGRVLKSELTTKVWQVMTVPLPNGTRKISTDMQMKVNMVLK
ncbi:MAG: hypothetical protein GTO55_01585, partial [Armatimonadetes bacterium]|nr:hypothetical protein [Armatimonadota bacterium]NIM22969.1 hypothetical protein [Armatimonadota bacterium]NIM66840.1 hypothetical protein [Armatimonadota bacterium]NIM75381.1 hypothetical protein [Armatimonadota bacterium]NIN05028.1 hypothetical protein [Armatimonadota bacterium]